MVFGLAERALLDMIRDQTTFLLNASGEADATEPPTANF
jgi:hypothetical protein